MKDALGDRMKSQYEHRTRYRLPRRTYTVVRIDGKNFHGYTANLSKPFDVDLQTHLVAAARHLCVVMQGACLAYVQSDEISVVACDFETTTTQAWFDGGVQKWASVSASLVTAHFNQARPGKLAAFDARVFTIPDPIEVHNYLVWRQADAVRNSISMVARAHLSHRECAGKSSNELQELLWQHHKINWNDYDPSFRRGVVLYPKLRVDDVRWTDRQGNEQVAPNVERRIWTHHAAPFFTRDVHFVGRYVPNLPQLPRENNDGEEEGEIPQRGSSGPAG